MTEFKKLTAYSDAKCEWVSSTYPYDEENAQLKAENAKLRELIVRCCDCESAREHYEGMDVWWWCCFLRMYVNSRDFCCWGERRVDG